MTEKLRIVLKSAIGVIGDPKFVAFGFGILCFLCLYRLRGYQEEERYRIPKARASSVAPLIREKLASTAQTKLLHRFEDAAIHVVYFVGVGDCKDLAEQIDALSKAESSNPNSQTFVSVFAAGVFGNEMEQFRSKFEHPVLILAIEKDDLSGSLRLVKTPTRFVIDNLNKRLLEESWPTGSSADTSLLQELLETWNLQLKALRSGRVKPRLAEGSYGFRF